MGIWRRHLDAANGFDQRFRAWSCEDDDLAARLRSMGVRIRTALGYTHGYHLWHPPHSTTPTRWRDGPNVPYLRRPVRLARCLDGLERRSFASLSIRTAAGDQHAALAWQLAAAFSGTREPVELELLFWPAATMFSGDADHRILLADEPQSIPRAVRRCADGIIALPPGTTAGDVIAKLERLLAGQPVDAPHGESLRQVA
jgi:hypothetical protein